jgi:hypothetical protein
MAVNVKIAAFWNTAPCTLVEVSRPTIQRLYGAISQKAVVF